MPQFVVYKAQYITLFRVIYQQAQPLDFLTIHFCSKPSSVCLRCRSSWRVLIPMMSTGTLTSGRISTNGTRSRSRATESSSRFLWKLWLWSRRVLRHTYCLTSVWRVYILLLGANGMECHSLLSTQRMTQTELKATVCITTIHFQHGIGYTWCSMKWVMADCPD